MRDPGLRDRGVEIRVGIFLILAAVVSVAGLFWIADSPFRGPTIRVWGVVGDAGQITPDSPVLLRGVEIGTVDEVGLEAERAVIGMTISTRIPLPADTRGTVRPSGFLGQQLIELMPGAGTRALAEGDTISLDRASDLVSLASSFGEETGGLIERLDAILTEQFAENVAAGSEALTLAMRELAGLLEAERSSIGGMLANMDTLSGRLSGLTGSEEVDRTLANLDTLSSRLAGASDDFATTGRSLAEITRRLEAGEGTLGKLLGEDAVHDGLLETLETLRAAGEEFGLLMRDIRERPDRYLEDIKISVF
ncbi:MlaD family protein [Candidatus Palauibacter sp.]|uniref:MlaD family protein n=1 Tax=Candidatus Palauibacter sp. TaxID=3101350 RepID=UPI003B0133E5